MSRFREYGESLGKRPSSSKGVTLEGFDEILLMIKKLPDNIKTSTWRAIMKKNMKPIAEQIKKHTPIRSKKSYQGHIIKKNKDGETSTDSTPGNLRRSIGVKVFSSNGNVTGYAGINRGKNNLSGFNADGWYGFFLERGTQKIGKKPFIAPAAAIAVPKAKERLEDDCRDIIVRVAKKQGLDAK